MKELYDKCQRIILDNYNGDLNNDVLEILTVSLMALFLHNQKLTVDKTSAVFRDIKIFADKKSVVEIVREYLGDENCTNENMGACVVRGYEKDDITGKISEKKSLVISLTNYEEKVVDVVEKVIHEFTHLLRDGGFSVNGSEIKLRNGISIIRFSDYNDPSSQKMKHFFFEEGIVQRYAEQAFSTLYEFIKDEDVDENCLLGRIKNEYLTKSRSPYEIQVRAIDALCEDENFSQLIDESFDDFSTPSKVSIYYNNKMRNSIAFTSLSREFDNCFNVSSKGDTEATRCSFKKIFTDIGKFRGNKVIRITK